MLQNLSTKKSFFFFSGHAGFRQRCELTQSNKVATFVGPIYCPLTMQGRLMLPLTPHSFTFHLSPNPFVLRSSHATDRFRVKIEDMKLLLLRVKVNPSVSLEIEKRLNTNPALYPTRRACTRALAIQADQKFYESDNLFPSQVVPRDVLVALNLTTAVQGRQNRSPFNFQPFGIKSLKITCDGMTNPSPHGFTRLSWTGNDVNFHMAYFSLFNYDINVDAGNMINLEEFCNSYCIFRLTLGHFPNLTGDHRDVTKIANSRLTVTFDENSQNQALTLLLWSDISVNYAVTSKRELLKDYTA